MFNKRKKSSNIKMPELTDRYLQSSIINRLIDKTQLGKIKWIENKKDIFDANYKGFFLIVNNTTLKIYKKKIDSEDELIKQLSSEDYPHISDLYNLAKLDFANKKYKESRKFLKILYNQLRL